MTNASCLDKERASSLPDSRSFWDRYCCSVCHPERSPSDAGARTESKDPEHTSVVHTALRHSLEDSVSYSHTESGNSFRVFHFFPGKQHPPAPLLCQILPARIHLFNQRDLLRPPPPFQLFLAPEGFVDVVIFFVVHQPSAAVLLGKALEFSGFMLADAHLAF